MRLPIRALQPISLQVPPDEAWHQSRLLDFTEGKELVVGAPSHEGEELPIEVGAEIRVEVILPDGVRRFDSRVRRRMGAPTSLYLDWPREATRIQRRDNVRVDVSVPVRVAVPPLADQPERTLTGTTLDVSAGGVRLNLPEAIPDDTLIEMVLRLPGVGDVEAGGRVLRSGERQESPTSTRHWNAVEFAALSEASRREITKFVFDVQREYLRRA